MYIRKIAILLLILTCVTVKAQKVVTGSLFPLNTVDKVNFEMEFISIHGMSEESFGDYEKDWYNDKPGIVGIFSSYANRKLKGHITLGSYPKSDFTVKAVINEISIKGDYDCDIVVLDKNKNVIAKISGITAKGGTWGTKLNLIKDGAETTGKRFGSVLKSEIIKSKR